LTETPTLFSTLTETPSLTPTLIETPTITPEATETIISTDIASTPTDTPTIYPIASQEPTAQVFNAQASENLANDFPPQPTPTTINNVSNVTQLVAEIEAAKVRCPNSTLINLTEGGVFTLPHLINNQPTTYTGSYGPNGLPIISCDIKINGNGSIIERSGSTNFRIFEVNTTGLLRLSNITIRNGYTTITGGGAVLSVDGGIEIDNAVFENNESKVITTGLGGAIYAYHSDLIVNHSEFKNNRSGNGNGGTIAGSGGAIAVDASQTGIFNSRFELNSAGGAGGGIYNIGSNISLSSVDLINNSAQTGGGAFYSSHTNGTPIVSTSCINGNTSATGASGIDGNSISVNTTVNAFYNWWGTATGAPSTTAYSATEVTINGYGDSERKCGPYDIRFVNDDDPNTKRWASEAQNVFAGLDQTSIALYNLLYDPSVSNVDPLSYPEAFNRVMVVQNTPGYILFVRANTATSTIGETSPDVIIPHPTISGMTIDYSDVNLGECKTYPGNIATNIPQSIVCNGDMTNGGFVVTEYTIAHELGHLFDYRSGTITDPGLSVAMGRNATGVVNPPPFTLSSCISSDFGTYYQIMGNVGDDWRRGPRGWGSDEPFSEFQQNITNEDLESNKEILEAAADMFLNWVYRYSSLPPSTLNIPIVTTDALPPTSGCIPVSEQQNPPTENWQGFRNINWEPSNNPYDWGLPGDVRYRFMIQAMTMLAVARSW